MVAVEKGEIFLAALVFPVYAAKVIVRPCNVRTCSAKGSMIPVFV